MPAGIGNAEYVMSSLVGTALEQKNLFEPLFITLQVPMYAYVLCAVGVFVYQTLDAIDGKQARRTGSNSPLGELFDHGCDAVSTGQLCRIG